MNLETVGISPKAWAAAVAGYVSPIIVGVVSEKLGVDIEVPTIAALLLPLITAGFSFLLAKAAKPGLVVNTDTGIIPGEEDLPIIEGAKDGEEAPGEDFER